MKLKSHAEGDTLQVRLIGDLYAEGCSCLVNFWELRAEGWNKVAVDLTQVETGDGRGMAILVELLRHALRKGVSLSLHHPPQLLAHTLYKLGELERGDSLTIVERPREEPYE